MKKVIVSGYGGAGKSTLCLLLDGHPELRVSYLMEKFDRVFTAGMQAIRTSQGASGLRGTHLAAHFILKTKEEELVVTLYTFRELLTRYSYIPVIEAEAFVGSTVSGASSTAVHSMPLNLDYQRFDAAWKDALFSKPQTLTIEQVLDTLYDCLFKSYRDVDWADRSLTVYCTEDNAEVIAQAIEEEFEAKFLIVRRPLDEIHSIHRDRVVGHRNMKQAEAEEETLNAWLRHPRLHIDHKIDAYAKECPERFMFLNIDDFVVNYRETMPRVAKFMEIDVCEALYQPTFHGSALEAFSGYLGEVKDRARIKTVSSRYLQVKMMQYRSASIAEAFASGHFGAALVYTRLLFMRKILPRLSFLHRFLTN